MKRDIKRLSNGQYDLLVIGGGINGAAVAHLAAVNGLKTVLLEKGDFASGTSSKSTKLIHGGLRYLENFEFGLVKEALRERAIQLKTASHLVKPLAFVVPVYKTDIRPLWMMRLGVALYDWLSGSYKIRPHQTLTPAKVMDLVPGVNPDGLVGGVLYYDAQMDDARLCLENVLSAVAKGAHVANYVEVKSIIKENGKAVGVVAQDVLSKEKFEVRARRIVSAVGPWTNDFLGREGAYQSEKVRTTKGVHLVYRGRIADHALLIPMSKDRRIFFVIPWRGQTLIGTTDTDYEGNPDRVEVDDNDVEYLLSGVRRIFPKLPVDRGHLVTSFAGLRPLVSERGAPSKVSRRHVIWNSYTGIIYVIGGKYTTYRKIAEDVLRLILKKKLVSNEASFSLYGGGEIVETPAAVADRCGVSPSVVKYLMEFYGARYGDVLALMDKDSSLKEKVVNGLPFVRAQIKYAIEVEMAQTVEDIMLRRLPMSYSDADKQICWNAVQSFLSSGK